MEWGQRHHWHEVAARLVELLADEDQFDEHRAEFFDLCRWVVRDCFDRPAFNRRLRSVAAEQRSVA